MNQAQHVWVNMTKGSKQMKSCKTFLKTRSLNTTMKRMKEAIMKKESQPKAGNQLSRVII